MKNLLMAIPFLILFGNGISYIWRELDIDSYRIWYPFISQLYALLAWYFMWYFARLKRFCAYSFIAIYGLVVLTLVNLWYLYVTYGYDKQDNPEIFEQYNNLYHIYGAVTVLCVIALTIIRWLRQRWYNG